LAIAPDSPPKLAMVALTEELLACAREDRTVVRRQTGRKERVCKTLAMEERTTSVRHPPAEALGMSALRWFGLLAVAIVLCAASVLI
jgi:hypothetical protein